jgi:hypothetical protein
VLINVQPVEEAVCVDHLGGETFLEDAGTFVLDDRLSTEEPVVLTGVFAVDADALPAGIVALLGVGDIRFLGLSLDAIADSHGVCLLFLEFTVGRSESSVSRPIDIGVYSAGNPFASWHHL